MVTARAGRWIVSVVAVAWWGGGLGRAVAQISPGELSSPHAALEGMGNCTKCHALGKAVSNTNCVACHTELKSRIEAGKGYHAGLKSRECIECHKEHHGRSFSIVRFDQQSFDHGSTGFALEGKHREQKCAKCHTPAKITAQDVLQNSLLMSSGTFLGLPRDCVRCHADAHLTQLGNQCQECHGYDGWKPAPKFVHDRARYRLTGKHREVQCAKCHLVMPVDGKTVRYTGLEFETCANCHADPHNGRFKKPCESCHTTNGWHEGAAKNFDHATTRFPLKGQHAAVRCDACHRPLRPAAGGKLVQTFAIAKFQKCTDCHEDAHRGEFARRSDKGACESCHTEKGFAPAKFEHATARFMLKGKHETTGCKKCHGESTTGARGARVPPDFRVKKFRECAQCHDDAHGGQFARRQDKGGCESCHREDGFTPPFYTVREHTQARFVLTGSHEAVPCAKCHPTNVVKAKSTRQFVWGREQKCESCHKDPHGGQFHAARYPGCAACHEPRAWNELAFSHDRTQFPITGKHRGVTCNECHKELFVAGKDKIRRYTGAPTRCVACHPEKDTPAFRVRLQ
ncbi:MAG: hypothetical protein AB1428_06230 [Bacteroidota bacterium]